MRDLPDIAGCTVVLTPFRPEFAEAYGRWLADPYIQRMAGEEAARPDQILARHEAWTDAADFVEYVVVDRASGLPIGDVSLDFSRGDPRLGVMIGEARFRGTGRAAEAVRLVSELACSRGAHRIIAEIYDFNAGSLTFHERLGFSRARHDAEHGEWICVKPLDG